MKDGEVYAGDWIGPFVTPILKAAIDFSTEKKKNTRKTAT